MKISMFQAALGIAPFLVLVGGSSADIFSDIGYDALVARLGSEVPSGAGVGVVQVEVPAPGYSPQQGNGQFSGIEFIERSGATEPSSHASEVGFNFYGSKESVASGIPTVNLYDVNDFIGSGYLRLGSSSLPDSPPGGARIFNHSWIGSLGGSNDVLALRRADYAANTFGTLWIMGVNNGAGSDSFALLAGMHHGISVGLSDGDHDASDTGTGTEIQGRMKPEIVAPGDFTSFSTPVVSACAALLYETASTTPELDGNSVADLPQVLKAVLLAGAARNDAWTNNPSNSRADRGTTARPLDEVFGAGVVEIDRAHRIYTGLEQSGDSLLPETPTMVGPGWDFELMSNGETLWHRFSLTETADEIGILVTWNRVIASNFSLATHPDLNLELFRIEGGSLVPLVGATADVFEAGNVRSNSGVDSVELVHVRGLAAGEYAVRLNRVDGNSVSTRAAIAWWIPDAVAFVPADLNHDGQVNGADFGILLSLWGTSDPYADLDGSGEVGGGDIGVMLAAWTG